MEPIKPPGGGEYDESEVAGGEDSIPEPEPEHLSAAGKSFLLIAALAFVLMAIIVAGIIFNANKTTDTNEKAELTTALVQRIENIGTRIEDCSSQEGACYRQNQENMRIAINAILTGSKTQMDPHRLRNEAENLCQVELFAGTPSIASTVDVATAVTIYGECVLRRSGGTEPPPLPENPYNTTTTTVPRTTTTGRTR